MKSPHSLALFIHPSTASTITSNSLLLPPGMILQDRQSSSCPLQTQQWRYTSPQQRRQQRVVGVLNSSCQSDLSFPSMTSSNTGTKISRSYRNCGFVGSKKIVTNAQKRSIIVRNISTNKIRNHTALHMSKSSNNDGQSNKINGQQDNNDNIDDVDVDSRFNYLYNEDDDVDYTDLDFDEFMIQNTDIDFNDETLLEILALSSSTDDYNSDTDVDDLDDELLEQFLGSQDWTPYANNNKSNEDEQLNNLILSNNNNENTINNNTEQNIKHRQHDKPTTSNTTKPRGFVRKSSALEEALMQGVVPADAGVGSKCLPGDYGFDPLGLSKKDYYKRTQNVILSLFPSKTEVVRDHDKDDVDFERNKTKVDTTGAALPKIPSPLYSDEQRPPALILRDYREAEIRHGRLAMLASILWPLQEVIDRLFIPTSFGHTTIIYGGVTLPYISLFMTFIMLLMGYLDIYAASIKDEYAGDAFLPGECFWDPLSMLEGAPDVMKRNMQKRELNNGRFAMIAVFFYIVQEAITHQPLISLPWNQILFEPAFEIPIVQEWLDIQFAGRDVLGVVDDSNSFTDSIPNISEDY